MPLRIREHPIIDFRSRKKITFYFNDKKLVGYSGDSIASALHASGVRKLSESLKGRPRGFFCGIGKCSSCLMTVNGIPNIRTCIAPLQEGIHIESQPKFIPWPKVEDISWESGLKIEVDILVVGAGPAGLSASIEAAKQGATVLLVDENPRVGGQLIKQTHKFFGSKHEKAGVRGVEIAEELGREVERYKNIKILLESTVFGVYEDFSYDGFTFGVMKRENYKSRLVKVYCRKVIVSVGAMENMLLFPGNDLPGVYGAGGVQTLMNVYGVKPGNRVLMVGAGNVGLIVSYQLLQAGVDVDRVVEAAPVIGGYHVHAAKIRRFGVPIYTSHSIKEVYGKEYVEGAVVVKLDENWRPIEGSEETVECDTVCLAVGLTPSTRLLEQLHVTMADIPEAGGRIAIHDEYLETTVRGVYVSGDSSGIEEASTAMIEGKIAGVSAALSLGYNRDVDVLRREYIERLKQLRAGLFGEKPRKAKERIAEEWRRYHEL